MAFLDTCQGCGARASAGPGNRASDYGSGGWGFESLRACHRNPYEIWTTSVDAHARRAGHSADCGPLPLLSRERQHSVEVAVVVAEVVADAEGEVEGEGDEQDHAGHDVEGEHDVAQC